MNTRLKIALVFAIVLVLVPVTQAANRVVTVYPIDLTQGMLTGEYEWARTSDSSHTVRLAAARVTSDDVDASAVSGGYGMNKYLDGKSLEGLYVGGTVTAVAANSVDTTTDESVSAFIVGIGGRAGYKVQVADSFIIDVGVHVTVPIYASAELQGDSASAFGAGKAGASLSLGVGYTW